jgi:hypothetical protein
MKRIYYSSETGEVHAISHLDRTDADHADLASKFQYTEVPDTVTRGMIELKYDYDMRRYRLKLNLPPIPVGTP